MVHVITKSNIEAARAMAACQDALDSLELETWTWERLSVERPSWLRWDGQHTRICPSSALVDVLRWTSANQNSSKMWHVESAIALHPNCPQESLAALANDGYWFTRLCVARNPSASRDVIEALSNDRDRHVSEGARCMISGAVVP